MNTEAISAVTALAAVVLSPLVSLYVVRKEVNAQVRAGNRQVWINELRSKIAAYLTEVSVNDTLHRPMAEGLNLAHQQVRRIHQLLNEIVLYLNPTEADHKQLVELLRAAAHDVLAKMKGEPVDPMRHRTEIVKNTQAILKREWERVKRGN